jgi:DNA-binding HxlR family transcriptional regulator
MRGYGQFCPVAKAAEIFAERWTPLIMRELLLGSHRFSDIERGLPKISKSTLAQRLRTLEDAGLIERRGAEYLPTQAGQELFGVIESLGAWGARWVNYDLDSHDIDPDLLLWDIHRRIDLERIPPGRTVVQIDFTGLSNSTYWLVMEPDGVSVCVTDPGFETDLLVTADTRALHEVWVGHLQLADALRRRLIDLVGLAELRAAFPTWLQLSMFAHVPRQRLPGAP